MIPIPTPESDVRFTQPSRTAAFGRAMLVSLLATGSSAFWLTVCLAQIADMGAGNAALTVPAELTETHPAAPEEEQVSAPRPDPHMGIYLTSSSFAPESVRDDHLDRLSMLQKPSFVVDVKGSTVYFDAESPLARELQLIRPIIADLHGIVAAARDRGFYTIARFIAIKDPGLASRAPATQIRHPRTKISVGNVWVDPADATVLEYNRQVLRDVARAGFDEINLDYIRYPTEYGLDAVGKTTQEKADGLEIFLKMARETLDGEGRGTKLGISTFAILGWDYETNLVHLGQDVVRFAPLVDVISPMAYPATFAEGYYYRPGIDPVSRMYFLVYRTLTGYKELLGPEQSIKLRPWIQGYGITEKNMYDQIQAVFDAGTCGFQVWNASNEYAPVYAALKEIEVPAGCQ